MFTQATSMTGLWFVLAGHCCRNDHLEGWYSVSLNYLLVLYRLHPLFGLQKACDFLGKEKQS